MPVWLWIVICALAALAFWRVVTSWWKFRGKRVITCPENIRPAGVSVATGHAALTALGGSPQLRLSSCTRWPEKADCGQDCLAQIHAAPEDCLLRNIVSHWFAGKKCTNCGQVFGEITWAGSPPALLGPNQKSMEWSQISADNVHEVLASSEPLCFACHTAFTLVREHPELIVNRHRVRE